MGAAGGGEVGAVQLQAVAGQEVAEAQAAVEQGPPRRLAVGGGDGARPAGHQHPGLLEELARRAGDEPRRLAGRALHRHGGVARVEPDAPAAAAH